MTREEIDKNVNDFIGTIKKEPCKEYFQKDDKSEEYKASDKLKEYELCEEFPLIVYQDALYQGYLDACRTIKWNKEAKEDGKELLEEKKKWGKGKKESPNPMYEPLRGTAKKIEEYFVNKESGDRNLDTLYEQLQDDYKKYIEITYGQAQKIINMAFKYLYCIYKCAGKLDDNIHKFNVCDMPLDSFSLEWFKRKFRDENFKLGKSGEDKCEKLFKRKGSRWVLKAESIGSWSAIESDKKKPYKHYPYEFYRDKISQYCEEYNNDCKGEEISPLELDFVVWPMMQKIMAAEAFIKAFNDEKPKDDNSDDEEQKGDNAKDDEPVSYDIDELKETCQNRIKKIQELLTDSKNS